MNFIPSDDRHPFKYYWDENATGITANGKQYKGIVIAILEKDTWEVINELEAKGIDIPGTRKDYFMNSTFKGISYCSVDDEFDLKKGMKIAKLRALKKYYHNKRKAIDSIHNDFYKDAVKIMEYHSDSFSKWIDVCDELGELEDKSDTEEGGE